MTEPSISITINTPTSSTDKLMNKDIVISTLVPNTHMLNHQNMYSPDGASPFLIKYYVDDENQLHVTFESEHHNYKMYGLTYIFEANVVPRIESLEKEVSYATEVSKSSDITTDVYQLKADYDKGLVELNPEYQRDFVWTDEQKESYILNLYHHIAEIKPTFVRYRPDNQKELIYEVLDGKQRLKTIFDFMDDKFTVNGHYYSELTYSDQQFLYYHDVKYTVYRSKNYLYERPSLDTLIQLFIEINMLGTRMSEDDLKNAQALLKG